MADLDRELSWDDTIINDGKDFILLPAGDYPFTVTGIERQRHDGSEKLPPCNKAVVSLRFDSDLGTVTLTHNLFLHTKTEGMISSFFSSIGLKKKGEPLQMNWNNVVGRSGKCKLSVRDWTNKDGDVLQSNDIKKFYPKEAEFTPGAF